MFCQFLISFLSYLWDIILGANTDVKGLYTGYITIITEPVHSIRRGGEGGGIPPLEA